MIEHWNGTRWALVAGPHVHGVLVRVAAAAADDAWAVGSEDPATPRGRPRPLLERWDGARWTRLLSRRALAGVDELDGVSVVGVDNVWVIGSKLTVVAVEADSGAPVWGTDHTLVLHWDGSSWRQVARFNFNLEEIAASSDTDVWAIGYDMVLHWNGSGWRGFSVGAPTGRGLFAPPGTDSVALLALGVVDSYNVWVGGGADVTDGFTGQQKAVLYHWNGLRWTHEFASSYGGQSLAYTALTSTVDAAGVWIAGDDQSLAGYESRSSSQLFSATAAANSIRVTELTRLNSSRSRESTVRALLDTGTAVWTAGDTQRGADKWDDFPTRVSPSLGRYGC